MLDNKIITFLRVCDTMNYTRAAEELHITQPAVSHHIHCLEEEYGVRLFEFKNKKIKEHFLMTRPVVKTSIVIVIFQFSVSATSHQSSFVICIPP